MNKDLGICRVCNWRKARYVSGTCPRCRALVDAEGTHEKFGIPKESVTRQRWRVEAAEYNKMLRKGMKPKEIAAKWGIDIGLLRQKVYKWKSEAGIKVISAVAMRSTYKAPVATTKIRPRINEHGGGRSGIYSCKCDLCRARRNQTRSELKAAQRAAKKQQKTSVTQKSNKPS